MFRRALLALTILVGLSAGAPAATTEAANPDIAFLRGVVGAVYTMTNDPVDNRIVIFHRLANGQLLPGGSISTGGQGTGQGIGNQASLALSPDHRWLVAVNAGSSDISVFAVRRHGLILVEREPAGGLTPISVAVASRHVYVLNEGGEGGISGFDLSPFGQLNPIPGSIQPLSGPGVDPAQIAFSLFGRVLIVTEKNTDQILTYVVDRDGAAGPPTVHESAGPTPFGFELGKRGHLFVSEAAGGADLASSTSSYRVRFDGSLERISEAVLAEGSAACWLVVTRDGRYAFTSNTANHTISTYEIGFDGEITLQGVTNTGEGTRPLDSALTPNSRFFYVLNSGDGTLGAYSVGSQGELEPLDLDIDGLDGANGLVAR